MLCVIALSMKEIGGGGRACKKNKIKLGQYFVSWVFEGGLLTYPWIYQVSSLASLIVTSEWLHRLV